MSRTVFQSPRAHARCAACVGVTVTALVLVLVDQVRISTHPPKLALAASSLGFIAVGWATGSLLGCVVLMAREELSYRLSHRAFVGDAVLGVLDTLALTSLVLFAQDPRKLSPNLRVLSTLGLVVVLVGTRWFLSTRTPRLARWLQPMLSIACIVACSLLLHWLRWNGEDWFRLALHLVIASSVIGLAGLVVASFSAPYAARATGLVLATLALALVTAGPILRASPEARLALHHRASHARSWAHAVERVFDLDGDGTVALFGGPPPRSPLSHETSPHEVSEASTSATAVASSKRTLLASSAAGSDILMISLDSLRWDAVEQLTELREALGPHLLFELAVSPAAATKESLSSTLRGRAVTQLNFESDSQTGGLVLWRDASPTLGHALQPAGYRVVTVPTSHVADPRTGMSAGFETIWVANFDARAHAPAKPPHVQTFVSAQEVLPIVLEAARETRGPLCAWVHLMEPHAPYRLTDPSGCDPSKRIECYKAALRETSQRVAAFVRAFAASRGKAPIIAVFGDHGEEFGEHGGDFHGSSLHAEQVRVGFMLAVPGMSAGRVSTPVSTAALPATLLELLGLAVPATMLEPSLLPSITGERAWPALAISELRLDAHFMTAYTSDRFRYLHDPVHDVELVFDLKQDPRERRDLAADLDALLPMRELARTKSP